MTTVSRPARALAACLLLAAIAQPARAADPDDVAGDLDQLASGFDQPVAIAAPDDGSGRLFVVEQPGRIRVWTPGGGVRDTPFLAITGRVRCCGEQGMLGLAFHPNYATNGRFYVSYTDDQGDLRVSRFRITNPAGNNAPEGSERIIIEIPHRDYTNHNAGQLNFGSRYLLISTGDGGGSGGPRGYAQSRSSLLGKILRIDVDDQCGSRRYCIPGSNPYAGDTPGRGEILHLGLRNPWRWSFDQTTMRMFIADVGQNAREEISVAPAGSAGLNFGWDCREGDLNTVDEYGGSYCAGKTFRAPVHDYDQTVGSRCAVIGGYVYRGSSSPALRGLYVYSDYCSQELWALRRQANGVWDNGAIGTAPGNITSFGQKPNGEVFAVTSDGRLWRVTGRVE